MKRAHRACVDRWIAIARIASVDDAVRVELGLIRFCGRPSSSSYGSAVVGSWSCSTSDSRACRRARPGGRCRQPRASCQRGVRGSPIGAVEHRAVPGDFATVLRLSPYSDYASPDWGRGVSCWDLSPNSHTPLLAPAATRPRPSEDRRAFLGCWVATRRYRRRRLDQVECARACD
jgi:hypothetical protein